LNLKLIHEQNTYEKITELERQISQQNEEVFDLKTYNASLQEQVQKLNSESESKEKFDEDIDELRNKSKVEVKAWKKELGEEGR
jgi:cell division protein FtsB